jgi:tricorn protease
MSLTGRLTAFIIISLLLIPAFVFSAPPKAEKESPVQMLVHPVFTADGKSLVFSFQGDLWKVSSKGGTAIRLTSHESREFKPICSPDGKWIAFSSNREGLYGIYLMPTEGGPAQRLTWHDSCYNYTSDWSADSRFVHFYSNRYGNRELYKVAVDGGTPIRLTGEPNVYEYYGMVSRDDKSILYCRRGSPGAMNRLDYHGSNNADLWLADNTVPLTNFRQLTTYDGHDTYPALSRNGKGVYFASDRDGAQNIFYLPLAANEKEARTNEKRIKQITSFTSGDVGHLNISRDGKRIAFMRGFRIWTMSTRSGKAKPLDIEINTDIRKNNSYTATYSGKATDYSVSPDGKRVAYLVGHDIFVTSSDSNTTTRQVTKTGARELSPLWFSDSRRLLYISRRDGNQEFYVYDSFTRETERLTHTDEDESIPVWSPDGKRLAYVLGENKIAIMDIKKGESSVFAEVNYTNAALSSDHPMDWSPDGKWLTFVQQQANYTSSIAVKQVTGTKSIRISGIMPRCQYPVWSPGGKHIAFIGTEDGSRDLFVIDLLSSPKQTFKSDEFDKLFEKPKPSPKKKVEKAKKDEVKAATAEVKGKVKDATAAKKAPIKKKPVKKKTPPVKINFKRIDERVRQLTSGRSSEWHPRFSKDGNLVYYISSDGGDNLWSVPVDPTSKAKKTKLTKDKSDKRNLNISPDGKSAYFLGSGLARKIDLKRKSVKTVPFRVTVEIDRAELLRATFEEAWWVLDRYYYDTKHHGTNWQEVRKRLRQALPYVSNKDDLTTLLYSLVGHLKSSHTGVSSSASPWIECARPIGYTGILFDPTEMARGDFVVQKVLYDSPATEEQARVKPGEKVLAINGHELNAKSNIHELLAGTVGKKTTLLLASEKDGKSTTRTAGVRTIKRSQYFDLLYEDMVYANRKRTHEKSDGKLGYMHVRNMDGQSLMRFKREIYSEAANKDGVIIDVRFNPGGSIAVQLLEIIMKRPWMVREVRDGGEISENWLRSMALEKPSVLLTNQSSGSNSEIMSEGFRRLGIGPVIGVPTPGNVIGTSSYTLINGLGLRRPHIGAYTLDGEDLEGKGRPVDIFVDVRPEDDAAGTMPQLDKAIEVLMSKIKR